MPANGLHPMTAAEAASIVSEMIDAGTPKPAQRRLLDLALGPFGNLSDEAKHVYRDRLAQLSE